MPRKSGQVREAVLRADASPPAAIDPQICRQCAGLCCKGHPGLWVDPDRFGAAFFVDRPMTPALLLEALPLLELDLRPIGGIPLPTPRLLSGRCVFLGQSGCTLASAQRPCQCQALIPNIETLLDGEIRCRMAPGFGSGAARIRWEEFWMRRRHP